MSISDDIGGGIYSSGNEDCYRRIRSLNERETEYYNERGGVAGWLLIPWLCSPFAVVGCLIINRFIPIPPYTMFIAWGLMIVLGIILYRKDIKEFKNKYPDAMRLDKIIERKMSA